MVVIEESWDIKQQPNLGNPGQGSYTFGWTLLIVLEA